MRALEFMDACGAVDDPTMAQASLYSSHEGVLESQFVEIEYDSWRGGGCI
jgi:3-deoxy-D-arabino-heptulosonate 7-phosphate (DAHP) synthase class II